MEESTRACLFRTEMGGGKEEGEWLLNFRFLGQEGYGERMWVIITADLQPELHCVAKFEQ